MARTLARLFIGAMALLVLTTGIVAGSQSTPASPTSAVNQAGLPVANVQSADLGLAFQSILLGGGMVFLFRPRRCTQADENI
jgi:hypothetical protein